MLELQIVYQSELGLICTEYQSNWRVSVGTISVSDMLAEKRVFSRKNADEMADCSVDSVSPRFVEAVLAYQPKRGLARSALP